MLRVRGGGSAYPMLALNTALSALVISAFTLGACQRSEGSAASSKSVSTKVTGSTLEGELLSLGSKVPEVSGTAQNGETVALRSMVGKPLVVYFYPKDETAGCTLEAEEIRDLWTEIQTTSAVVVGVSTDDADSHKAFADKHALPFFLLPDPTQEIARAFGVALKDGRAARVSFVFDDSGKLVRVFPKVNPRGHAAELLATLKSLR